MSMLMQEQTAMAAQSMARQMDDEYRSVLDAVCPGWTLDQVRQHCRLVRVEGSPIETLYWDSTPLLDIHPIETSLDQTTTGWVYRVSQNVRRLAPQPTGDV